ncbi:MAG: tetratricopeptide repeat protein [Pseudomonadales bacterium]
MTMKHLLSLIVLLVAQGVAANVHEAALDEAKSLLLDAEYQQGVESYQALLAQPDVGQHEQALEYLGVAYERLGQTQAALSSYQAYLARFSDAQGAARVRQRLDVLLASGANESTAERIMRAPESRWQVFGGISQDLWLDAYEIDGVEDEVSQSNLITFVNLGLDGRGDRYEVRARVDAGYQNALSGTADSQEDEALVSGAFVSVADLSRGMGLSVGRQSLYGDGVLGRYDGARASYQWREGVSVHATAGLVVDSPRYVADSRRQFAGLSVHLDDIVGQFDIRPFVIARRNDGFSDREAVGTEVRWRRDRWQLVGNVDYDLSYQTLNSVYVHGNYQLSDRLTLYARGSSYSLPFLTSTNALIGQPYNSLDTLADSSGYSDSQVRTLARSRTAQAWNAAAGLTMILSQRWYITGSTTYIDTESSLDTGAVAARPGMQQFYSSANLIGSSIFREGDTTVLGYNLDSNSSATTNSLRFELRLPFGSHLRLGPLLNLSYRDAAAEGEKQYVIEPGLRMTYRWRQRYRLELQARGRWSNRELPESLQQSPLYPDDEERASSYFFQLGWRVDL